MITFTVLVVLPAMHRLPSAIEEHIPPDITVKIWLSESPWASISRIEGSLTEDVISGRSPEGNAVLEKVFEPPVRLVDLRFAHNPDIDRPVIEKAARRFAERDSGQEGRLTVLLLQTDLGYGLGRMLQVYSSMVGHEVRICRTVEEAASVMEMDLSWYQSLDD